MLTAPTTTRWRCPIASSLFFAGFSTKLQSRLATALTLVVGAAVFILGVVWIAKMPIQALL
jgi:hypothetical protein